MSRRISLNLELNKRLSRTSNYTPCTERSMDSVNENIPNKSTIDTQRNLLKESLLKTRETIRSRIISRRTENNADQYSSRL